MVAIPIQGQTITPDWALEVCAASRHSLAFRDVADPSVSVRVFPSIMKEMNGLFRIKGDAQQKAQ
jgi:hypothetical protein